jgi:hypothetical protein
MRKENLIIFAESKNGILVAVTHGILVKNEVAQYHQKLPICRKLRERWLHRW